MLKKLIPVIAILIAAVGGLFGGDMLRPKAEAETTAPAVEGGENAEDDGDAAPAEEEQAADAAAKKGGEEGKAAA